MTRCDAQARETALDIRQSFIVQAPAGSGKTELLIQRYLALLGNVTSPKQIIAITFTRKAAAEMRQRITQALQAGTNPTPPQAAHQHRTWQLAQHALEQGQKYQWDLLAFPQQMEIMTIDALCARLNQHMPISSESPGGTPSDRPNQHYQAAAAAMLEEIETAPVEIAAPLARLISHFDNNIGMLIEHLSQMLARRDQWLSYLATQSATPTLRDALEASLQHIVSTHIQAFIDQLPNESLDSLLACLRFADSHLPQATFADLIPFDQADPAQLDQWQALSNLFLTADGSWRKTVTVRQGFPASSKAPAEQKEIYQDRKAQMLELISTFASNPALQQALIELRTCPATHYTDAQWQMISDLIILLPRLYAHLKIEFAEQQTQDFAEIAIGAMRALGSLDAPSDLALALDYRIQHLLIDEFQDTSISQMHLLEKLTEGWQADDGRTLFLVGDPMQSIYRFRQAEVSLFIQTQQQGIGDISLHFLKLQRNFRSAPALIDWFNHAFDAVFPTGNNIEQGAIAFSHAQAARTEECGSVHCHWQADNNTLIELIQKLRQHHPEQSIAILVRSRGHLQTLLNNLHHHAIPFSALEIERLADQPVIIDLLSLTQLLLHPNNHLAWLSVLRAPWCGLSMRDLWHLNQHLKQTNATWQTLDACPALSTDSQQRLTRCLNILHTAIATRDRQSLSRWIKQIWLALSGPVVVKSAHALHCAEIFFKHLDQLAQHTLECDWQAIQQEFVQCYADHLDSADNPVQIMTIHRSKGLEFDHVLIPSIDRATRGQSPQLLWWQEVTNPTGGQHVLFCPTQALHTDVDAISQYLQRVEKQKSHYETSRLLYVAATRARYQLHWLASCAQPTDESPPTKNSFLGHLFPGIKAADTIHHHHETPETEIPISKQVLQQDLRRLPDGWQSPFSLATPSINQQPIEPWSNQRRQQQLLGTIIHGCLQHLTLDTDPSCLKPWAIAKLTQHGIAQPNTHWKTIQACLTAMQEDSRGRWILSPHQDAHNEYPLIANHNGVPQTLIIDRTFIADGTRWIIDYKTTARPEADLDSFYQAAHAEHQAQLQRYAQAMQALDPATPTALGLYFPLWQGWMSYLPSHT